MKLSASKNQNDSQKSETLLESRERAKVAAADIFKRLIVAGTESIGFPRENTSKPAVEEGVRLNQAFLKIENPHVRALIIEFVDTIADVVVRR